MKKTGLIIILLFSSFFFVSPSFAKENKLPLTVPSGITPDSFLYPLDQLSEKVILALTFNSEKKATKAITFANERTGEMTLMAMEDIEVGFDKASSSRQDLINQALSLADQVKKESLGNSLAGNISQQKEIFQQVLPYAQEGIKEKLEQEVSASEPLRKKAILSFSQPASANLDQFWQDVQSSAERIKANCPQPNYSSWHFQVMCTTSGEGDEEYHDLGGPCFWEESGKIEAYQAQSEIISYLGTAGGKSKEINCEVSCGSSNCPLSEDDEAKRKNCSQPIYQIINFPWPEDEELKNKLKAGIDEEIAIQCQTRGLSFKTDGTRLTESKEKDCQIVEGSCDYTVVKDMAGKDRLARSCCCSCERPERKNLVYGQGLTDLRRLLKKAPATEMKPTPTNQPPANQNLNFSCQLGSEIVDGFQMNYLTVNAGGQTYKFPEFTCADGTSYKVAWCDKVKSVPAEKINNQEALINLFYEAPVVCEPMVGQTASCVKTTAPSGLIYGKCSYSPNY